MTAFELSEGCRWLHREMRSSLVSLGARETLALKQWARGTTLDRAAGRVGNIRQ